MNNIKYYLIQWTWGFPMSILGLFVYLLGKGAGWRIYNYRKAICIVVPWKWMSAVSLGMFIVHNPMYADVLSHEYGHSIQNANLGWLFPIIVGLPSLLRCWYHYFYYKFAYPKNRKALPDYYSIWFEKEASELGAKAEQNTWSWL